MLNKCFCSYSVVAFVSLTTSEDSLKENAKGKKKVRYTYSDTQAHFLSADMQTGHGFNMRTCVKFKFVLK